MVNVRHGMVTGLVSVRVLHATTARPMSGVELSENLAAAGHRISPGTLYPLLHQMEKAGWLKSDGKTVKGKRRRYYRLTKKGRAQLQAALDELERFLAGILEFSHPGRDGVDSPHELGLLTISRLENAPRDGV
jgi:DNA-binding PadR family transcriptional regulator